MESVQQRFDKGLMNGYNKIDHDIQPEYLKLLNLQKTRVLTSQEKLRLNTIKKIYANIQEEFKKYHIKYLKYKNKYLKLKKNN